MAAHEPQGYRAILRSLYDRATADHRLQAEFQRARREFFGDAAEAGVLAEQRFREWVLLERESLALAAVPAAVLAVEPQDEVLRDSTAGVWCVQAVHGTVVEGRDLQDGELVELHGPAGVFEVGDVVVGRLYAGELDTYVPSPAVAIYRPGQALARALERDLGRLQLQRRLSQVELEHLLLRERTEEAPAAPKTPRRPVEHLEAELDAVLEAGGADGVATEISEALAQSPRPGQVVTPLLEQLAFDTDVDLERARRLLVELWSARHGRDDDSEVAPPAALEPQPRLDRPRPPASKPAAAKPPATPPADETLGQKLARTLDEGLAGHRDVDELFRQLEAMAGIEADEVSDAAAGRDIGDAEDEDDDVDYADDDAADDYDDGDDATDDDQDEPAARSRPARGGPSGGAAVGRPAARGTGTRVGGRGDSAGDDDLDVDASGWDDDGDLGPLVTEYLWETGRAETEAAQLLQSWVSLQQNAALPHTSLHEITGQDLMRLLLHVYLQAGPEQRAARVRAAFAAVEEFSAWADETQELTLAPALACCRGPLLDQIDRLQQAGIQLSSGDSANGGTPLLLRVEEVSDTGFGGRSDDGSHWVSAERPGTELLRADDLVLGALCPLPRGHRLSGPVVVLPGSAESLIG